MLLFRLFFCILILSSTSVFALSLPLPTEGDVVGHIRFAEAKEGETLADAGRRFDIGSIQMKEANPEISASQKLHAGVKLVIPMQFILPDTDRVGLVINLAEQRLYYYPPNKQEVITEPVGIGRSGQWRTPIGLTKITKKEVDPYWHPTNNVRLEAARNGTPIPSVFPPGPNNPLGRHIFRLGWPTYLIHSTNQPESVGGRVSAGCIRMLPEGIAAIYDQIEVGTPVNVVNQTYKIGWANRHLYLESHLPLRDLKAQQQMEKLSLIKKIEEKVDEQSAWVSWQLVQQYSQQKRGLPQIIGNRK